MNYLIQHTGIGQSLTGSPGNSKTIRQTGGEDFSALLSGMLVLSGNGISTGKVGTGEVKTPDGIIQTASDTETVTLPLNVRTLSEETTPDREVPAFLIQRNDDGTFVKIPVIVRFDLTGSPVRTDGESGQFSAGLILSLPKPDKINIDDRNQASEEIQFMLDGIVRSLSNTADESSGDSSGKSAGQIGNVSVESATPPAGIEVTASQRKTSDTQDMEIKKPVETEQLLNASSQKAGYIPSSAVPVHDVIDLSPSSQMTFDPVINSSQVMFTVQSNTEDGILVDRTTAGIDGKRYTVDQKSPGTELSVSDENARTIKNSQPVPAASDRTGILIRMSTEKPLWLVISGNPSDDGDNPLMEIIRALSSVSGSVEADFTVAADAEAANNGTVRLSLSGNYPTETTQSQKNTHPVTFRTESETADITDVTFARNDNNAALKAEIEDTFINTKTANGPDGKNNDTAIRTSVADPETPQGKSTDSVSSTDSSSPVSKIVSSSAQSAGDESVSLRIATGYTVVPEDEMTIRNSMVKPAETPPEIPGNGALSEGNSTEAGHHEKISHAQTNSGDRMAPSEMTGREGFTVSRITRSAFMNDTSVRASADNPEMVNYTSGLDSATLSGGMAQTTNVSSRAVGRNYQADVQETPIREMNGTGKISGVSIAAEPEMPLVENTVIPEAQVNNAQSERLVIIDAAAAKSHGKVTWLTSDAQKTSNLGYEKVTDFAASGDSGHPDMTGIAKNDITNGNSTTVLRTSDINDFQMTTTAPQAETGTRHVEVSVNDMQRPRPDTSHFTPETVSLTDIDGNVIKVTEKPAVDHNPADAANSNTAQFRESSSGEPPVTGRSDDIRISDNSPVMTETGAGQETPNNELSSVRIRQTQDAGFRLNGVNASESSGSQFISEGMPADKHMVKTGDNSTANVQESAPRIDMDTFQTGAVTGSTGKDITAATGGNERAGFEAKEASSPETSRLSVETEQLHGGKGQKTPAEKPVRNTVTSHTENSVSQGLYKDVNVTGDVTRTDVAAEINRRIDTGASKSGENISSLLTHEKSAKAVDKTGDTSGGTFDEGGYTLSGRPSMTNMYSMPGDGIHQQVFSLFDPAAAGQDFDLIPDTGATDKSLSEETVVGVGQGNTVSEVAALETGRMQQAPSSAVEYEERVLTTVVRHAALMLKNGQSSAVIRLEPPNLGTLKLEIVTERSRVTGKITVENHEVKQIVENRLAELRQTLSQNGLKVESFDVQIGHNGGTDAWAHRENLQGMVSRPDFYSGNGTKSGISVTDSDITASARRTIIHDGSFDIRI